MLIMTLSYTQKTQDLSLVKTYVRASLPHAYPDSSRCVQYNLLDQWAQFLVSNTLEPANQLSSDAFAGTLTNQTNLALKGIIALKAMAQIADLAGHQGDSATWNVSLLRLALPVWCSD